MRTIKKMMAEYDSLPEHKRHEVWEVIEEYLKDISHSAKKEMGYKLAVIVYGECLTLEEAQHIVEERFGGESGGHHWTVEEIKGLAQTKNIDFDKEPYSLGDLYAVMHSEYYNHYDFIYSLASEQSKITDYAFKLAQGFLDDEDAPHYGKGKARKYFHFVI